MAYSGFGGEGLDETLLAQPQEVARPLYLQISVDFHSLLLVLLLRKKQTNTPPITSSCQRNRKPRHLFR